MKKFLIFVSFICLLCSTSFSMDVLPKTAKTESNVACKNQCKCCNEALQRLEGDIKEYNEWVSKMESCMLRPEWDEIKKDIETKRAVIRNTQSDDPELRRKAYEEFKQIYMQDRKLEQLIRDAYEQLDEFTFLLPLKAQMVLSTAFDLLDCKCVKESKCDVSFIEGIKEKMSSLVRDRTTSDIHNYVSQLKLSILSGLIDGNDRAVDMATDYYKRLENRLQELPRIYVVAGISSLKDCCKEKTVCPDTDIAANGTVRTTQEEPLYVDDLYYSGAIDYKLHGYDRATGHFADFTIINNTGRPIHWIIPEGLEIIPNDEATQRMIVTKEVRGSVPPGGKVTVPLTGVCVDDNLYPMSEEMEEGSDMGLPMPPVWGWPENVDETGPADKDEIPMPPRFDWPEDVNLEDIPEQTLEKMVKSFFAEEYVKGKRFFSKIGEYFEGDFWREYIAEFFKIPFFDDIILKLRKTGEIIPTGMPEDKENETIQQWATWSVTDDMDKEDAEKRVDEQLGDNVSEDFKKEFIEKLLKNVDLVKKKARQCIGQGKQERSSRDKQVLWYIPYVEGGNFKNISNKLSFVSHAYAKDYPSFHKSYFMALISSRYLVAVLSTSRNLIRDTKKLILTEYADNILKLNGDAIVSLTKELNDISNCIRENRVSFDKSKDVNTAQLLSVYYVNKSYLVQGGILDTWITEMNNSLSAVYSRCNVAYKKLIKRGRHIQHKGKEFGLAFSKEEREFMKIYTRVRIYYKFLLEFQQRYIRK